MKRKKLLIVNIIVCMIAIALLIMTAYNMGIAADERTPMTTFFSENYLYLLSILLILIFVAISNYFIYYQSVE
ncbi:MAG: hypothetical protein RR585_15065 [Coprobacillus sp.]